MDIGRLIAYEDKLFYQSVKELLYPSMFSTEENAGGIEVAQLPRIAFNVHSQLLRDLFYTFACNKFGNDVEIIMPICFDCAVSECNLICGYETSMIPCICEELHIAFLNSKFSFNPRSKKVRAKSKEQLIALGAVYTQPHIAHSIVQDTFANLPVPMKKAKILDFACGTGRFYENIVAQFESPSVAILENVYAVDIDRDALYITRLKALATFDAVTEEICKTISSHIILRDVLKYNNSLFCDDCSLSPMDLDGMAEIGFDAIVSNPPYLVLKPNKSKAGVEDADEIQRQVNYFRSCGLYRLAIEGMLNLYQLSIERMLQMLKRGGVLGVICPSTLFGDVSASKLRKHLLTANEVVSIRFYAEKMPLFENVNQATNIFILKKGGRSSHIYVTKDVETFEVDFSTVKELFPVNLEIPAIKAKEWEILRKLSSLTKLKQLVSIRNRRGELDLTLYKQYITTNHTPYRLVRGNMISNGSIKDINGEYVDEGFVLTRSSDYLAFDFGRKRLVCQQISNGGMKRRLRFVYCDENDILGNSCNYISADEDTLAKMYLLLNSSILNWRFKITSSNNHINNYELGELPIVDLSKLDTGLSFSTQEDLDKYVGALYGLSEEEQSIVRV